ncbi:MAG: FKBP-type peptidyl-prolyl cis-trans isomerase [Alistipes sp.]|nr:FKBP-type peptidyl-prolyl cis-trans isomerase [Alistipes sp.]
MKKMIFTAAVLALAFGSMACGGGPKLKSDIDSLSYAIGVDLGLNVKFGVKDLELDQKIVLDNLKEFMKSGDIESEEFMKDMQFIQTFQYTKFMPYMQVAMLHERSDRTDTLPQLPELYDETYTREEVARCIGRQMAANVVSFKEEAPLVMAQIDHGMKDAMKVEEIEKMDEVLKLTGEQMQQVFTSYQQKLMAEAEAEAKALAESNGKASAEWLAEIEKMEGVQKTESGLLYRIDREGNGKQATKDEDVVKVNYEGKTRDGKIFDSSYERGEAIEFGLNQVIKGWTEGMKLVKVGGQITLWIPAEMAYGERGAGEDIGPNEALEFKVELLDVTSAE